MSFDGSRISRRQFLRASAAAGLSLPMAERLARLAWAAPAATKKNVADVLRFSTRPQGWKGLFGFVTFRLHPVLFNGQRAYHIRTDASDQRFAREIGVVWVPKLAAAAGEASADYYLFTNGGAGQLPVASTIPSEGDFTPAYRLHRVTFKGSPKVLDSVQKVKDAESAGDLTVAATNIVVNYPVVKWPGGELSADTTQRQVYLGPGQLLSAPDVNKREVTFKLHQCYPGEWYIVTDTSAVPMAPMMKIAPSPKSGLLTKAGSTAKILVLGNGVKGPGPMGFQPSIVDSLPGDAIWSPFWDHFTLTWNDGKRPSLLRNVQQLTHAESSGGLKRWPGTPDTKGELFVVNCPVPVTGPMTWRGQ